MDGVIFYNVVGRSLEGGGITGAYFHGTHDECESWIADYEDDPEFQDIWFAIERTNGI